MSLPLADAGYRAQRRSRYEAAAVFQAAVTSHAKATGQPRHEVEQAVKKAMRHAVEDPAE
ncbi:hypothetical protein [Streptomyces huasconensis]|uniref:hypothetical protein n=1 Tax=Streptomyces huasconensis TaxID=1854574 RepID=UPI0034025B08